MVSRHQKPTIPEPSPAFFGWSLVVGFLIVAAVMVSKAWLETSVMWASRVSYQIIVWSAVVWVAIRVAPNVYALNDLTTWR
jgi:hypothetical protein